MSGSYPPPAWHGTGTRWSGSTSTPRRWRWSSPARSPIVEARVGELDRRHGRGRPAAGHHRRPRGGGGGRAEPGLRRHPLAAQRQPRPRRGRAGLRGDRRRVARGATAPHLVVIRSTVLPGTMRGLVIPTLERAASQTPGPALQMANNPEFLRELTAIEDYENPPNTVVGADDPGGGGDGAGPLRGICRGPPPGSRWRRWSNTPTTPFTRSRSPSATRSATSPRLGIDSWEVMDIFCEDRKLNISAEYLRPGFAFGGSCLPKDVRALTYRAASSTSTAAPDRADADQRPADRPGAGDDPRDRDPAHRLPRHQLQGRHRRPAREPPGGAWSSG